MDIQTETKNESISVLKDETKIALVRSLGLTTAILMVACTIIGSGIFKKIAPMSAMLMNKNYILLAWVIAGILAIFLAFIIGGLPTMNDESGGIYEYLRLCFGNLFSFLYGWASFLILGCGSIAAVAYIFAESVNSIVPLPNPLDPWKHISIGHFIYPFDSSGVKILALICIAILTWINVLGAKKGGNLNNVITVAKIAGIFVLIIMGLSYTGLHSSVSTPVIATNNSSLFSAIFAAVISASWAYTGSHCIGFMSGEIKNPQRNVPIATIAGVGIVIVIYLLVNAAFMNVLPLSVLATTNENSIAGVEVARSLLGNTGVVFIALLIAVCTFGTLNAIIITYPRMYYRMAQEKFFPKSFSYVHPRYRTPYVALIWSGIWSCVLLLSGTFDILTDTIVIVSFLFSILLAWGLIKMKREGKITARIIAYPLAPIVLILSSMILIVNIVTVIPVQSIAGLIFTLSGIPLYYFYKKRKKINGEYVKGELVNDEMVSGES